MEKTKEQEMLSEAFEKFDISLLQKCLDAGYDINVADEYYDTYFSEAIFCYGSENFKNTQIPVKQVISFLDFALKHGLDINHKFDDCGELTGEAFDIIKYCFNDEVAEFLIQHGLDLNYMVTSTMSFYDYISAHVFWDERGSDEAKFVYYRERLITYYGSKPSYLLENKDTEEQKKLYDIILSFNLNKISQLTEEEIIKNELDYILVLRGQFYYSDLWYKNSLEYQKKLITLFDVLFQKITIKDISKHILYECIYQQLPELLEYLLEKGANPNVNCFSESYSWVKSSAMYELFEEGNYFTKELYDRFLNDLERYGAIKQEPRFLTIS